MAAKTLAVLGLMVTALSKEGLTLCVVHRRVRVADGAYQPARINARLGSPQRGLP
jgi:hypothetical protein